MISGCKILSFSQKAIVTSRQTVPAHLATLLFFMLRLPFHKHLNPPGFLLSKLFPAFVLGCSLLHLFLQCMGMSDHISATAESNYLLHKQEALIA